MSYQLQEIILSQREELPKNIQKEVAKVCQKILHTNFYPDAKKMSKMKEVATEAVNDFFMQCLKIYRQTPHSHSTEDNDITTLRGVWASLAFSEQREIYTYLEETIADSIAHKGFAHRYLFETFRCMENTHSLLAPLTEYYDALIPSLPIYQLLDKLGVSPSDKYQWEIGIKMVNFHEWFTDEGLSEEEKQQKFTLDIRLHSPFIYDGCFSIDLSNASYNQRYRIFLNENAKTFSMNVDESRIAFSGILHLDKFVKEIETHFGISFYTPEAKSTYFVSKGINRKRIIQWVENKWVI